MERHTGPVRVLRHAEHCDSEHLAEFCDCRPRRSVRYSSLDSMLRRGWWWECTHCGRRTDEESDDDGNDLGLDPCCTVYSDGELLRDVFCTPACLTGWYEMLAARQADEAKAKALLLTAWPDAVIERTWFGGFGGERDVPFRGIACGRLPSGEFVEVGTDGTLMVTGAWRDIMPAGSTIPIEMGQPEWSRLIREELERRAPALRARWDVVLATVAEAYVKGLGKEGG